MSFLVVQSLKPEECKAEFGHSSFKQYLEAKVEKAGGGGTYQTLLRRIFGLQYNLFAMQTNEVYFGYNTGYEVWKFLEKEVSYSAPTAVACAWLVYMLAAAGSRLRTCCRT
jgi:hypothetical protein